MTGLTFAEARPGIRVKFRDPEAVRDDFNLAHEVRGRITDVDPRGELVRVIPDGRTFALFVPIGECTAE